MEKSKMLQEIMALDFSLIDLNLYLDTHPYDVSAINMYNSILQRSKMLKTQYQCMFAPIMPSTNNPCMWQWIDSPWPWQKSF